MKLFPQSSSRIITQPQAQLATTENFLHATNPQTQCSLTIDTYYLAVYFIDAGNQRHISPLP
ncbi:hypothetical protein D3C86_1947210 [compost metagenome]